MHRYIVFGEQCFFTDLQIIASQGPKIKIGGTCWLDSMRPGLAGMAHIRWSHWTGELEESDFFRTATWVKFSEQKNEKVLRSF